MAPDVATAAAAYSMMSGESVPLAPVRSPRLGVPAGWVAGLDAETARAWALVSDGIPEVDFPDRKELFDVGLTILLVEAAAYHRRWATECPEKYRPAVIGPTHRALEVLAVDFEAALLALPRLRMQAQIAMKNVDALLLPATAIVAPLISAGTEVREPLARFTRPFNTTGQPVVALPAPASGLPVGIQVVGKTNAETLSVAAWLERKWNRLA